VYGAQSCLSASGTTDRVDRSILFVSINGGTADLFWGYLMVMVGAWMTYASLAEMASM
jgi:hypothetical protein